MRKTHSIGSFLAVALAAGCTNLTPPDEINPNVSKDLSLRPTGGYFEWRIPKTVLDTKVSWIYRGCSGAGANIAVAADAMIEIDAKGVPDNNPFGPRDPRRSVRVPMSDVQSVWQDRSFTIKQNPDGTLAAINSIATDNTGAIVGSLLTTAAKIPALAAGVPAGAVAEADPRRCRSDMERWLARATAIEEQLKTHILPPRRVEALTTELGSLNQHLTITQKATIDPGVSTIEITEGGETPEQIEEDGKVATLYPKSDPLSGWIEKGALSKKPYAVHVYLDFAKASPALLRRCAGTAEACPRYPVRIDNDTHFREPAYIPVRVKAADKSMDLKVDGDVKGGHAIPFAQFGLPRAVPIGVGLFQKIAITVAFDEFGGFNTQSVASDAVGTRLTSFLSAGATAANSHVTNSRNVITADDPATLRAKAETARLKAQMDLAKARADYKAAAALGQVP